MSNQDLILIIDDDSVMKVQLKIFLQKEGYGVIICSNGLEGLQAYKEHQPHLVLLDAMMPVMNGFDCCSQIMAIPGAEQTPVLMITGLDDRESVDQAFAVGATDYVTKPIHWPVLRQRVKRLLYQVRLQKELEEANRILERLAMQDGLTGISNRRQFDQTLSIEWRRLSRENLPMSLIIGDVDFFKLYNDTYGHQAGDRCLQKVAKAIATVANRAHDLVARYGGEEFIVMLPNTELEGAIQVGQKIRQAVKSLGLNHQASPTGEFVTISLGLSCLIPHPEVEPEILIKQADQALYQAKTQGRDRLVIFS